MSRYELCTRGEICIKQLYDDPNVVVIVTSKYMQYDPSIDRSKVYCSRESLFNYHFSLKARSGYHLMPRIDEIILRLIEAGISAKWDILQIYEKKLINTNSSMYTSVKINEKRKFEKFLGNSNNLISLNVQHVGGAFLILFLGNSVAFVIFLSEIVVKKLSYRSSHAIMIFLLHVFDATKN